MNYIEKRLFRRVDSSIDVDVHAANNNEVPAKVSNISCGGLFLQTEDKQALATSDLKLAIHLPNRDNPVVLAAEVIRRDDNNGAYAFRFQGLYNDSLLEIDRFVKSKLH